MPPADDLECLKWWGWVIASFNAIVCLDDLLDSRGDEVVEGVNFLLDEARTLRNTERSGNLSTGLVTGTTSKR